MIRQLVGCLKKDAFTFLPEDLQKKFETININVCYDANFIIETDCRRKVTISLFAIEYIWSWIAYIYTIYDYCHKQGLVLSDVEAKWNTIIRSTQVSETLDLQKVIDFNDGKELQFQNPWPKKFKNINPMNVDHPSVKRINLLFHYVMIAMILHEFGHIEKNHAEDYSSPSSPIEHEADLFSFNKYIEHVSSCHKDILENGAWVGVIFSQMILLDRDGMNPEYRKIYGNPWQRISFAIAEIEKNGNFGDDASMYAFLSLSFWLFLKKRGYDGPIDEKISFKDQYDLLSKCIYDMVKAC